MERWWPEGWFNPLEFMVGFLSYQYIIMWFHEFWHLAVLQAFGGQGHVGIRFMVFYMQPTVEVAGVGDLAMAFAGGLGAAATCLLFWFIDQDIEDRIVFHAIGWSQALYGVAEGFTYLLDVYGELQWLGFVAMMAGCIYALARSKKMWSA